MSAAPVVAPSPPVEGTAVKFVLGGLSCCIAALFTNPIDVVKVRLQLRGELGGAAAQSKVGFLSHLLRTEGLSAFYKGLSASLMREASYSTIRMGGYEVCKTQLGATDPATTPLWKKIVAGGIAGATGAAIANPTDLVKVRLQADTGSHATGGPRYKSTLHAFKEVYRTEGWAGLYRGVGPTTQRAALLTAAQLSSYDHAKQALLRLGVVREDNLYAHFWCVASFL
ncbi:mitochondrial carrier protein [Acanthamoeba castellanii str. Neff]|uniref:Mitochondrial carrier protein n=1 Tax=Acanthamoeba castellanii (strain ATCC 30010 / Neff) TaxID=1257118 RepID=L8GIL2_ACACF|nr:mitochondrial carrier protein [Acanthamoeba castellanii str. Neff]ELR12925.1 mitochondrial carrier protein [Acanthamoeba castellanii str. Neff]